MSKKRMVILGAGESGVGAALLAKAIGFDTFVSDNGHIASPYKKVLVDHKIDFEEGNHSEVFILQADEVVKSPGIPCNNLINKIIESNIAVIDELEFAARYTKARLIAVTGTNGKTTTSLLIYHLLREAGYKVGLAGNVGESFARQVVEDPYDYYVLEVSSFQLEGMHSFKPYIAVLLNITPDHLDRYEYDIDRYIKTKFRLIQKMDQGDYFIYFADDENITKYLKNNNINAFLLPVSIKNKVESGAYWDKEKLYFTVRGNETALPVSALSISGKHNYVNAMGAVTAAMLVGLSHKQIMTGLNSFRNIAHRMEYVADIEDIIFINDSKATNVDAVYYALGAVESPIIWIAGGIDKGNNYQQIKPLVTEKVKAIISLGKDSTKLKHFFEKLVDDFIETDDIYDSVSMAYSLAQAGDTVLLSPACASFDLFKNFEDRGEQFKLAVAKLQKEKDLSNQNV